MEELTDVLKDIAFMLTEMLPKHAPDCYYLTCHPNNYDRCDCGMGAAKKILRAKYTPKEKDEKA